MFIRRICIKIMSTYSANVAAAADGISDKTANKRNQNEDSISVI